MSVTPDHARPFGGGHRTALRHQTKVTPIPGTFPKLFGAECLFCAWESNDLWSDPEAAEQDAAQHETEANGGA